MLNLGYGDYSLCTGIEKHTQAIYYLQFGNAGANVGIINDFRKH